MGKRDRERIARILAGEETPISARTRDGIRKAGVSSLRALSTSNQVSFLADSLHSGRLSHSKLQKALKDNAYREMRKGVVKIVARGKTPNVDLLLSEYRKDREFQKLANEVGLDENWFTILAESECEQWRTKE